MSIRVLIVDDSLVMRKVLQERLSREDDIEVVGCACDAQEARALMKTLDPDVVTLDVEMPGMDGLSFLQKIMELRPTPVIIVSGTTNSGDATAAHALQLGAVSCYAKGNRYGNMPLDDGGKLASLVREAAQVKLRAIRSCGSGSVVARKSGARTKTKLIAIGSSTGGVEALRRLLPQLPAHCPPTVIVQHVNARFSAAIAKSLDAACDAKVLLAESDILLEPGHVYLAPGGDRHLLIRGADCDRMRTSLRPGHPVTGHMPSIDVMFRSVAEVAGDKALGILLTGMGQDGAEGLLQMLAKGARTIAQDEKTSVVFGMPRAAIDLGAAEEILPLPEIGIRLQGASAA